MPQLFHYVPTQNITLNAPTMPTPPQAEGNGTKILKAALGAGADALRLVAKDYNRYQSCRVSDMVQERDRRMEEWKTAYMEQNQGRDATNAQRDFSIASEKISKEIMDEFGGHENEVFRHDLEKKLLARGLMDFQDGGRYQQGQTKIWEKSVWEGELAKFNQDCAQYADDPERLNFRRNELLESWKQKNPGQDHTAMELNLLQSQTMAMAQTMVAQQNWDGAQNVLDSASGTSFGAAQRAGGTAPNTGKTIAEDLHNPLNLKKVGANGRDRGSYEFFATDADGFRGAANQLALYNTKYSLNTPKKMVQRWAPASDGNNHERYFAAMRSAGFKDIDAEIDVTDKRQMARLVKAMATAEGPLGARYSVEQIEGFLSENDGKARRAAAQPAGQGILTPAQQMQIQHAIDAGRAKELAALKTQAKLSHDDYLAQCNEGITLPEPDPAMYRAFGEEGANRLLEAQAARDYSIRLAAIRKLPLVAQQEIVETMRPQPGSPGYDDRIKYFHKLEAENKAMQAAWKSEPCAWLARHDPDVNAARARLFSEFSPDSFQKYQATLLTAMRQRAITSDELFCESDARTLAGMIEQAPNPKKAIKVFEQAFGSSFGKAMDAIMPKASEFFRIAAEMDDEPVKTLMEARKNQNFIKDIEQTRGIIGVAQTQWKQAIADELAPLTDSLLAGGDSAMAHSLRETAYALSLVYRNRNMDEGEARERACREVLLSRYEFAANKNGEGVNFRIPKGLPAEDIAAGAKCFQEKAEADKYAIELNPGMDDKEQRKIVEDAIRGQSHWVTAEDESGLYLFIGSLAVKDRATGKPLKLTWQQLADWKSAEDAPQFNMEDY